MSEIRHGSRLGYQKGCMCAPCVEAERAYQREYRDLIRRVRGVGRFDADPARQHLAACVAVGMTFRQIARVSGVAESTLRLVANGERPTARAVTLRRITAVPVRRPTSAVGITRRVRALAALGWSTHDVAAAAGLQRDTIDAVRRGDVEHPKWHVLERVVLAYDRLSMRTPPTRTRHEKSVVTAVTRRAARNHWAPPLAWDDDTIDDPAAGPDGAGYRRAPVIDQIRDLESFGLDREQIGERLGVTRDAVDMAISRAARAVA